MLDKPVINDFDCVYSEILDILNKLNELIPIFRFNWDSNEQNYNLKYLSPEERNGNNEKFNL